jgi:hypothetical protein
LLGAGKQVIPLVPGSPQALSPWASLDEERATGRD